MRCFRIYVGLRNRSGSARLFASLQSKAVRCRQTIAIDGYAANEHRTPDGSPAKTGFDVDIEDH